MHIINKVCFFIFLYAISIDASSQYIHDMIAAAHEHVSFGQVAEAISIYDELLLQYPHSTDLIYNKAYALKMADKLDDALVLYKTILHLEPFHKKARFGLAMSYLYAGDFSAAWPYYDAYLNETQPHAFQLRNALRNNAVAGKKVVLHFQGGLGDTVHFVRYVQLLKEMGAYTIVYIQKPLFMLLSRCTYIDKLLTTTQNVPSHDIRASLMALPALFESTEETIPRNIPYIFPDESLVAYWKKVLSSDHCFRIGVCWQADLQHDSSRYPVAQRSIPLDLLRPLAQLNNIKLYSLQKPQHDGIKKITDTVPITIFEALDTDHGSFMDTAALIKCLDLIISVDTAVAHIAGALGAPTYLLLPYSTDWRWLAQRTDSPWYPSMTIFKQQHPFEWEPIVCHIIEKIDHLVRNHKT